MELGLLVQVSVISTKAMFEVLERRGWNGMGRSGNRRELFPLFNDFGKEKGKKLQV